MGGARRALTRTPSACTTTPASLGALLTLACMIAGCRGGEGHDLEAPPPIARATLRDTLPALPPSLVEAPITYDFAEARAALEAIVPRTFGDLSHRIEIPNNRRVHVAFAARRSPFTIRVAGDSIELTTVVAYEGRGWYDPKVGPEVHASCGTSGESPRVRVRLVSAVRLAPDWTLRVRTRLRDLRPVSATPRDACLATLLRIDVTPQVLHAVRSPIEKQLSAVDRRIAQLDLRSRIAGLWATIQRPIRLGDSLWFQINPRTVRVGGLRGDGDRLIALVGLTASPRIRSGARPANGAEPLPALEPARTTGRGAHVLLEGRLDYDVASAILNRALEGKRFEQGPRTFVTRKASVYPLGDGRVAMRLRFGGNSSGTAYLVGTPRYSITRGELAVPDLEFDVATEDLLVRSAAWIASDQVRDYLRERAHWPVAELVEQARGLAERALNRELTRGVRLAGTLSHGEVLEARALPEAIVVRAHADGALWLDIDREIPLARR